MIDLMRFRADLKKLDAEAKQLGVSRNIRDRIRSLDIVIEVIDREREKAIG